MKYGLNIRKDGALDFLSLGALVHRLDLGTATTNGSFEGIAEV